MIRLMIHLNETEAEKLAYWAALEMRDPRDQIRFLIRQALLRQGLLPGKDGQLVRAELPDQPANAGDSFLAD